jgi:hypothetical protein
MLTDCYTCTDVASIESYLRIDIKKTYELLMEVPSGF